MLRVGLYGINGHQIQEALVESPRARLAAVAAFPAEKIPPALRHAGIRIHASLDELLADPAIDLVSLCSPRRAEQSNDAVRALRAGKHVLAEKPCAPSEAELDRILRAARESGKSFQEMAETAFIQPYAAMREIVGRGELGEIVQVIGEKSYPWFDGRAQDEMIDGGLIGQNALHAFRWVEHVARIPIASVYAVETSLGNPVRGGGLRMAASIALRLANGGIASLSANYLNPRGSGVWGDESLRIVGTAGVLESRGGGAWTRLIVGDRNLGPIAQNPPSLSWLELVFQSIAGGPPMPLTLEAALSPTRWAIRAKLVAHKYP